MGDFFLLIFRYKEFFLFLLLETLSIILILNFNQYHRVSFLNSSNQLVSNIYQLKKGISNYLKISEINEQLSKENRYLKQILEIKTDSIEKKHQEHLAKHLNNDSTHSLSTIIVAKVINNSVYKYNNYITINKGLKDGIEEGMGVISQSGVVGKIDAVSQHFAIFISILHSNFLISSTLLPSGTLCSSQWSGESPQHGKALFVPRHIEVVEGNTIVTSGFNSVFPPNTMIGNVKKATLGENDAFYDIDFDLATDFHSLSYVYAVKGGMKHERDSLELNYFSYE